MAQDFSSSYAAFFAPRTHKFETISFRLPTSRVNLESYFPQSSKDVLIRARIAGFLGVAIGIVTAFLGFGIDQLTRGLTLALYRAVAKLFDTNRFWWGAVVYTIIALVFTAVAACMVVFIAPLGAGSGIPELKSYLNGVKIPGFLKIDSLVVKSVGIAFSLSSGLICGKQGPVIHAGAIVGASMSQFASSKFKWRWNNSHIRFLRTEAWKRDFSAVGAAVGIAVAFGSPMGAWMWVYEEACTHWTWDLGIITLSGCVAGTFIARTLNHLAAGVPRSFDLFTLTQFGKLVTPFEGANFFLKDIPGFVALAVIGGVCGAILPAVNKHITLIRYKHITKPIPRIAEALLITFLTALARLIIPYLVDDCRPINENVESVLRVAPLQDHSRFTCAETEFSPWATVMYNPTDSVVRTLLFAKGPSFIPAGAVAVAFGYYFIFIIWTYGVAVPAGVFFPAFLLGSVYGRLVGIAIEAIFPGRSDVSLTGYSFLGAISALAGFTRTISVAVIALEATGGYDASFAAVIVALLAKLVGDWMYSRGIYDLHIDLKGIPYLRSTVPHLEVYQKLRVSDVMQGSVIGVRRLSRVSGLVHMLRTIDHHGFPVFVKMSGNGYSAGLSRPNPNSSIDAANSGYGLMKEDEDEDTLSRSETSILEAELNDHEKEDPREAVTSRIVMPSHNGMQATIFDDGTTQVVNLTDRGEVKRVGGAQSDGIVQQSPQMDSSNTSASAGGSAENGKLTPHFELMGSIDRGTLVTLLKHECAREERRRLSGSAKENGSEGVSRDDLDAAWPNPARLKGDTERMILDRVEELGIGDHVIDLRRYIDPDPLLMSDRALSMAAYQLFRGTGTRHIFVTNMRSGRVCGIMTRKDILEESVREVLGKLEGVKVE